MRLRINTPAVIIGLDGPLANLVISAAEITDILWSTHKMWLNDGILDDYAG